MNERPCLLHFPQNQTCYPVARARLLRVLCVRKSWDTLNLLCSAAMMLTSEALDV